MKKILVSIDGSRSSINALKYAVKMARLLQAEIVGIHVINETSYSEYYQEISNKLKKEAEGVLKRVVDAVQKEGVVITTEVDTGIPDVILAQRAKTDPHVAMIVTSESRRGLVRGLYRQQGACTCRSDRSGTFMPGTCGSR